MKIVGTRADAEIVAIDALSFIAEDENWLNRFLSLSGISAFRIREVAREPEFLVGVLQFLLSHENILIKFSDKKGYSPELVISAHEQLDGCSSRV